MLLAGDEFGNSQPGSNAHCQDNPLGWADWAGKDKGFHRYVARLTDFRARHPVMRQAWFLHGDVRGATAKGTPLGLTKAAIRRRVRHQCAWHTADMRSSIGPFNPGPDRNVATQALASGDAIQISTLASDIKLRRTGLP